MDEKDLREVRAAEDQSLFRAVNDEIERLNRTFAEFEPYGSWACECASTECMERIEMTLTEYEELRADPTHFAVFPAEGHVLADMERVVGRNERYWTVEKVGVAAARAAELADHGTPGEKQSRRADSNRGPLHYE